MRTSVPSGLAGEQSGNVATGTLHGGVRSIHLMGLNKVETCVVYCYKSTNPNENVERNGLTF